MDAAPPDVRLAAADDSEAIRGIRNAAINDTVAIWTAHALDAHESRVWLEDYLAREAIWVAVVDGHVVGFACFGPWREKEGYRFTVETSVYILDGYQGRGAGRALMSEVIPAVRASGAHVIVVNIEASNTASIELHRQFGFTVIGTLSEVGNKFGRWLDLTIMQLRL